MATKTTKDTSLQSTKQMLDELDALMEKMLALPVNDPEDAAPFPEEVVKAPNLPPTVSATLTLLEPPAPVSEPPTVPEPVLWHPATNPPHFAPPEPIEAKAPPAPVAPPVEVKAPAPQPEPLTNDFLPSTTTASLDPLLAEIPEPETPTTAIGYPALLWINQGFDHATACLGGAGDWLRSQAGRTLLGVSGVALMLVAAGWLFKDLLGWN